MPVVYVGESLMRWISSLLPAHAPVVHAVATFGFAEPYARNDTRFNPV
jgi:hypothetical protein